jgi:uncharacterized protein
MDSLRRIGEKLMRNFEPDTGARVRVTMRFLRAAILVVSVLLSAFAAPNTAVFNQSDEMIPMRDGVRLHTVLFTPKEHPEPLPILLMRTPYGVPANEQEAMYSLQSLIKDGYILAFQHIRGRFKSEGEFVMLRPPRNRNDKTAIDESTDTYDSIEWMMRNVPGNNKRVGMWGVSYGGWLVTMALLDPHPALKAASEQASPADMFLGDDFHHNGAFRLSYGFEYAALLETARDVDTDFNSFKRADTYQAFLDLGVLTNINKIYFHGRMPTWNNFLAHPNYDAFWKNQAVVPYINSPLKVPNLNVAGWWDQEDFYGPIKIYEAFEKHDPNHLNYLVAGPWNHGGWRRDGSKLGEIPFDSNTSEYFRQHIEAPWFAYWLHDKGSLNLAEANVFQTGSNRWKSYRSWPPAAKSANLYIRSNGKLSFDAPEGNEKKAVDTYISDPLHPVPYRHRPISPTFAGVGWKTWLVEDQRFVDNRPDVLTWQTDPLENKLAITGDIMAQIYAQTTGTDADWIVKLIDVYPEHYPENPSLAGYELMIASDILRGRFRESVERPSAIKSDVVTSYKIDLHANDHIFLKGHRVMVQIQSTWFPLYDLNPQTFVENIFTARASDFQKATHSVFHSPRLPSHIVLSLAQ